MIEETIQTKMSFQDFIKSFDQQLVGEKIDYNIHDEWGIQVLVIEITNSNDPSILPLVQFLNSSFRDTSVMKSILFDENIDHTFFNIYEPWSRNENDNFECKITFEGSLKGVERRLLEHPWFKNVDIDFFFDTRRKIGHSSYSWNLNKCSDCSQILTNNYHRVVNYFISKDKLSIQHLFGYDVFREFIRDPYSFPNQEPGRFVTKSDVYDKDFEDENRNQEYLLHSPEYTSFEFDDSFFKLIKVNLMVRPEINKLRGVHTFHNCIKDWVKGLNGIDWLMVNRLS